ncbi:hypothetical protein HDV63DRAFT_380724 [Trichoderma sp. SZMC 28014]
MSPLDWPADTETVSSECSTSLQTALRGASLPQPFAVWKPDQADYCHSCATTALGYLAFLTLAMAPFPYVFYRYGKKIRGTSRYALS